MRVAAVAVLVLAMSRPLVPGAWLGGGDREEVIVIVDNSMSMMRGGKERSLFASALNKVVETLKLVEQGDSVRILSASPYPVWVTPGPIRIDASSRERLYHQIQTLRPTGGSSDLLAALFTAVQADIVPTHQRRRIILLTDGQSGRLAIQLKNKAGARFPLHSGIYVDSNDGRNC